MSDGCLGVGPASGAAENEFFASLRDPEVWKDPHPTYHRLRTATPQWFDEQWGEWVFTRYEDCMAVLRDPRWSSNPDHLAQKRSFEEASFRERQAMSDLKVLLFMDPPDHTRLRGLVSKAFTPRSVERLRPRIGQLVDSLLDDLADKGEFDLISELAFLVPVTVICELMGVPVEDHHLFGPWSSAASRLLDGDLPEDAAMAGLMGAMELINYFNALIDARRANPGDDLLSGLVHAEEEGDKLTEDELRSITLLLFIAGHETTMNLIGNGTLALLRHPDQLQLLRDDPTLIGGAVEECLRYDGPVHVTGRIPTEDLEIAGQRFTKGTQVVTLLAAANRDPERFSDPDRFDIRRPDNHHLTFSHGIHYCLGASLARLEGQITLGTLVQRFPGLALRTEDPVYREHFVLRGLRELRVAV